MNDQPARAQLTVVRVVCGVAILLCDAVSAALSYWPLGLIGLVVEQVKANVVGPPAHIIDDGEDSPSLMVFYVVIAIVLLMLTALPAVIGNVALGPRAGWPTRVYVAVAVAVVLAPVVVGFMAPLTMNEIWYRATHGW